MIRVRPFFWHSLFAVTVLFLNGANLQAGNRNDVSRLAPPENPEPKTTFFDDMLVEESAIDQESYKNALAGATGAVKMSAQLWQDGVLPIAFPKNISKERKAAFFDACNEWSKVANVRCVEGAYNNRRLLLSTSDLGCWSLWGMGTHFLVLRRRMNLADGCWHKTTILHELGHAFGLIHEHQRPDRDKYITVHTENVSGGFLGLNICINFGEQGSTPLTNYDFRSIMHYPRTAFSKNGKDTIVPKPEYEEFLDIIGRGWTISTSDAAAMARLYGPPRPQVTTSP